MKKISKFVLASLLLAFAGAASAQQATQPKGVSAQEPQQATQQKLTPEQQAQLARQDAEMFGAAAWVVHAVDKNNGAEVWQGSSPVFKGVVTQDKFVKQVALDRQRLGAVTERKQIAVTRTVYTAGGQVPAGNYINVSYATKFANAPQPIRELVSFHFDDDKVWRVSGYSVR